MADILLPRLETLEARQAIAEAVISLLGRWGLPDTREGELLGAFVTGVPEHASAATGVDLSDSYPDGFQFSLTGGPFPLPGTRQDHFASDT